MSTTMYFRIIFFTLFLLVVQTCVTFGFSKFCDVNHTVFVPVGRNASFVAEDITFVWTSFYIRFYKAEQNNRLMFIARFVKEDPANVSVSYVLFYNTDVENRTIVKMESLGKPDTYIFTIIIQNATAKVNGTYYMYGGSHIHCWILFALDIQQTSPGPTAENSAVQIYGHPIASLMVRPLINATMLWLLDGVYVNQTTSALAQDGVLWIVNVNRQLHGRNVTYRAMQDNGDVVEANLTLEVAYGPRPTFSLIFTPENTQYSLKSGDTMPDISCHADCNPLCQVTWMNHSSDNTLRLGRVSPRTAGEYTCAANGSLGMVLRSIFVHVVDELTVVLSPQSTAYFLSAGDSMPDINCSALCFPPCITTWKRESTGSILRLGAVTTEMSGEYVCTASRNDTSRQLEKSVMLFVTDDRPTRTALIVVGSIQACTTVVLGICCLLYCFRRRGMSCSDWMNHHQKTIKTLKEQEGTANKPKSHDTELDIYEELNLGRGKLQLYDQAVPEQRKKKYKKMLEVYENTAVA